MAHPVNVKMLPLHCLFLILCLVSGNADTCVKKGPCRCEFENGTAIDLSEANDNFFTTSMNIPLKAPESGWLLLSYYFHPCKNARIPDDNPKSNCTASSLCKRTVTLLKRNNTYEVDDSGYEDLGSLETVNFLSGQSGNSIVYEKTGNIKTTILLQCVRGDNTLVLKLTDPVLTVMTFYSPLACPFGGGSSTHSLGTTLLIIVMVMALAYIIIGCLVKRFLMGAQGIEIIPNLTFWRELPNLVKDGIAFLANGFRPPPQASKAPPPGPAANPNSYDSI